jgi:hypothetical protein
MTYQQPAGALAAMRFVSEVAAAVSVERFGLQWCHSHAG